MLKVFPDTKANECPVTPVSDDREGRVSPAKDCDGTEGDDEPVQRLIVCRKCKAFFNDTTSLLKHEELHKTGIAIENKVCDDSTEQEPTKLRK